MQPDARFLNKSKQWWADVRTISQAVGYTQLPNGEAVPVEDEDDEVADETGAVIKVATPKEIVNAYNSLDLDWNHLFTLEGENYKPTPYGREIIDYLLYRAESLLEVSQKLMSAAQAKEAFEALLKNKNIPIPRPKKKGKRAEWMPLMEAWERECEEKAPFWQCGFPLNKQKGEMRQPAFLTGIVNMTIALALDDFEVDLDPKKLTAVTKNRRPLRVLSRRVDGAYPKTVNPIAIWEIKEYYYSKTFGSRIADGVYETLLDGMEIKEMSDAEGYKVKHYLIVDAYSTWWEQGKSYMCRMVDMMHMGYVDEVIFGSVRDNLDNLLAQRG